MTTANTIWRDFVTDGIPASGANKPAKAAIRIWGTAMESIIAAGALSDAVWKATKAILDADLAHDADTIGVVYDDSVSANNGLYKKVGASASGSWTQLTTFLPGYQFVTATDDGNSTANTYTMDTSPRLPVGDGVALVSLIVPVTNTNNTVTISFDGGAAFTVKTASGGEPAVGGLVAGMPLLGVVVGSEFRMRSDQASAAVLAQMETLHADFVSRYLGAHPDDASATAEAGGSPTEGQLYWNTTSNGFFVWDGASWTPFDSSTIADGSVTRPKLATIISRTLPLNIAEYGVTGNDNEASLTDETAAIQAAIDAAVAQGRELFIPGTNYQCGFVTLTNAFKLFVQGDPINRPIFHATQVVADTNSADYFKFVRTTFDVDGGTLTVAADILPNKQVIALNSVAGLEPGMMIELSSDALWYYDNRGSYTKGDLHLITGVNDVSNEVEIFDFTRDFYDISAETVTVRAWWPDRFVMNNVGFKMPAPAVSVSNTCLEVSRCMQPEFNDVYAEGATFVGIMNTRSWNARYSNPDLFRIGRDLGGGSTAGYGINDRSTVGTIIRGLTSQAMRRAVDFHTIAGGAPARDWIIEDFNVNGGGTTVEGGSWWPENADGQNYGIGMHIAESGTIRNGYIAHVQTGINNRQRNIYIEKVRFRGRMQTCVSLTWGTNGTVVGCTYDRYDFPDKVTSGSLDETNVPDSFIQFGAGSGAGGWEFDDGYTVVKDNHCNGLRTAFMEFSGGAGGAYNVWNMHVAGNTAIVRPGVGETFTFYDVIYGTARVGWSFWDDGSNIVINDGAGDVAMYDPSIALANTGQVGSAGALRVGASDYVMTIPDDGVAIIPNAAKAAAGTRVVAWITANGSNANGIVDIVPGTGVHNAVGNSGADLAVSGLAPLAGTTGADAKLNVAVDTDGKVYIENRLGISRIVRVKFL